MDIFGLPHRDLQFGGGKTGAYHHEHFRRVNISMTPGISFTA